MKSFHLDFNKMLISLIGILLLLCGCRQYPMDPDMRLALIVLVTLISFIVVFTKPISGIYVVSIIAATFSPSVNLGFANLYAHQWVILIALLASISSGLILENFHTRI